VRAGADLSLEFALPNTNQPIGVSTICSFREDPACFLLHSPGFPFGRRSRADTTLFDSGTRRETPHSSGLQLTLQPVMRISISNPLFNVIFWRP
jgi:hypothetical protein